MPTLAAQDVTDLTTSITSLFQSMVDFFIDIAPILVLVTAGWVAIRWLKNLVKAKNR